MKSSDSSHSDTTIRESEAERFVPDRDGPELAYEHVHRYLFAAKLLEGMRVLDLAAGSGYGALLMERAGCHVTTLDIDPVVLRGNRSGLCADARAIPLRDRSFDAVVCFEAIEHIENPEALVSEVRRVLCNHSIFLVSTPDRSIYSDRAGHQNPHHLAEMNRSEFTALLERHFEYTRISGQGLWAGSWITTLDKDTPAPGLTRRKVDATRWQSDSQRVSEMRARWASPQEDELPVPVYLLASCSNSTKGWNRIKRRLSTDSVLHDPSQWLIGQYERLVEENVGRNDALESQIDRARHAQEDLLSQLRAARTTIDEQSSLLDAARSSMIQLEEELRDSRKIADRQSDELRRARSASDDQREQLTIAREAQRDLQGQLAVAARASSDHVDQLERARESIDRQRLELDQAEAGAKDMESQIEATRSAQADLQAQLETARSAGSDLQAQVEAARSARIELESQLDRSREEFTEARSSIDGLEIELATARDGLRDLERQVENARTVIVEKECEIRDLQAESVALHSRIEDFECAQSRLAARTGHRLADWIDMLNGSR